MRKRETQLHPFPGSSGGYLDPPGVPQARTNSAGTMRAETRRSGRDPMLLLSGTLPYDVTLASTLYAKESGTFATSGLGNGEARNRVILLLVS
jgi:hypothetical protein